MCIRESCYENIEKIPANDLMTKPQFLYGENQFCELDAFQDLRGRAKSTRKIVVRKVLFNLSYTSGVC